MRQGFVKVAAVTPKIKVADTKYNGQLMRIYMKDAQKAGAKIVVFPELSITGMVAAKPEELVNYKPHSDVKVKLTGFEEELFYDSATEQQQHVIPYEIEDGVLKKCNLKPILQFV
jgi:predicted amidohydrolase